jgi:hypothetical protein
MTDNDWFFEKFNNHYVDIRVHIDEFTDDEDGTPFYELGELEHLWSHEIDPVLLSHLTEALAQSDDLFVEFPHQFLEVLEKENNVVRD